MDAQTTLLATLGSVRTQAADLLMAANAHEFDAWSDLINFCPPTDVQREFIGRPGGRFFFNNLEGAKSPRINLDHYILDIATLPKLAGLQLSPQQLAEMLRRGFTSFFESAFIESHEAVMLSFLGPIAGGLVGAVILNVRRYAEVELSGETAEDDERWKADRMVSMNVDLKGVVMRFLFGEKASVIVSAIDELTWIFSTVHTPESGDHPVSGCRQFGVRKNADQSYSFFTRTAERETGIADVAMGVVAQYFQQDVWLGLLLGIRSWIESHEGSAILSRAEVHHPSWETIKAAGMFHPAPEWIPRALGS